MSVPSLWRPVASIRTHSRDSPGNQLNNHLKPKERKRTKQLSLFNLYFPDTLIAINSHIDPFSNFHISHYYFPFPQPNQSLPFANSIKPNNKTMPTTCAYSKNLSLGLRPLIISTNVKTTCPPSNAGMGNKFINARMIDKNPVILQKTSHSPHSVGKIDPMDLKPPNPL